MFFQSLFVAVLVILFTGAFVKLFGEDILSMIYTKSDVQQKLDKLNELVKTINSTSKVKKINKEIERLERILGNIKED